MIAAIIFDLDGVLVNTEPLKGMAHAAAIDALGGDGRADWYRELMGMAHDVVVGEFLKRGGVEATIAAYDSVYRERYAALMRERLRLTDGADALHGAIVNAGLRAALVTSSARWMAEEVLTRLSVRGWFEVVITADDVEHHKPDPEPYLTALARLRLKAGAAIAIEDSASGVRAADAAGLRVFAIRHELNGAHDLRAALAEFTGSLPSLDMLLNELRSHVRDAATSE